MFNLYIERNLGVKGIAALLNKEGIQRRDSMWSIQTVYLILTNPVYKGQKLFNQRDWKTRQKKDDAEIVKIPVSPIVSEEVFELVKEKLASRSPKMSHPRRLSSPRLLTGVLRCGECEAAMTLATGKSNTYFYLQLLVKEIELKSNQATIKGSYKSLVGAVRFTAEKKNLSTPDEVLRFNDDWRARRDSNSRPSDP